MKSRLIIVSNRLPYKIEKKNNEVEIRKSAGGLVSALDSSLNADSDVLWVGAADFSRTMWEENHEELDRQQYGISPVFLDKQLEKKYYNGFSNTTIWPLFHYFPSYAEYREDNYKAYREVNHLFAEHLSAIIRPDDIVWVHDYHLMLLPGLLKKKHKNVALGFFLHIPFPSYEILKLIPEKWRNDMLYSLLRCDVLGFHTKEYAVHFKQSLSYFLGIDANNQQHTQFKDNTVLIKDYPISIDYARFNDAYDLRPVALARKVVRSRYPDKKIIFSVDRLDYTKGVLNRLQAYEELLNERPELRQQVVFVINVVPSRDKHVKYAERRKMIEEQVSHINGIYGSMQWQPIIYQYSHLTFNQLVGFYTGCDVALVTPLRDGMNLVAKEFVASRKDKRGVLILSEFAGAADELQGACMVNPNDVDLMKNAMLSALEMPEAEQAENMERMQAYLSVHDVRKWTEDFLHDLKVNRNLNVNSQVRVMSRDERGELYDCYRKSGKRLILLDYDGTLSPFYETPEEAAPDVRTLSMIGRLSQNPRNKVVIISGRGKSCLEHWFNDMQVDLVAEHGGYYRDGETGNWSGTEERSEDWKPGVLDVFERYTEEIHGSFIEQKDHSLTWHYRKVRNINEPDVVARIIHELMIANPANRFNVMHGKKIIEVKSNTFNKGSMANHLLSACAYDFVLAIGDDITDEDMFIHLNGKNHFTVKVGLSNTSAMYNLIGVSNVFSFLEQLAAITDAVPHKKLVNSGRFEKEEIS